jgi:hypothetical protein
MTGIIFGSASDWSLKVSAIPSGQGTAFRSLLALLLIRKTRRRTQAGEGQPVTGRQRHCRSGF